jgi:hypothetical protein
LILKQLETNEPDYIFWLKPPIFAYEGHSILKRSTLPLSSIDDFINNQINLNKYSIVYIKPIVPGNDLSSVNYYKKNITESTTSIFICEFCTVKRLEQMQLNLEIEEFYPHSITNSNYVNIKFKNLFYLSDFIEKYNITPLQSNIPIFYILHKN